MTQEQFADALDVSRSRIGSYEENRSDPPIDMLIKLSEFFSIPVDILIKNDLTKSQESSFIEIGNQRVLFPILVDEQNDNLIEVVPVKASAGYLQGYNDPEFIEQLERIKLPFLRNGKYRAFPIKGDSMLPLKDGAYVIAQFIENIKELKNGRTYVVVTLNDGIVYKRVYDELSNAESLLLVSDNKAYAPFKVHINEVIELWEFSCSISTQEFDKQDLKISHIIQRFDELSAEINSLKKLPLST